MRDIVGELIIFSSQKPQKYAKHERTMLFARFGQKELLFTWVWLREYHHFWEWLKIKFRNFLIFFEFSQCYMNARMVQNTNFLFFDYFITHKSFYIILNYTIQSVNIFSSISFTHILTIFSVIMSLITSYYIMSTSFNTYLIIK